jgi:hypothetical protein
MDDGADFERHAKCETYSKSPKFDGHVWPSASLNPDNVRLWLYLYLAYWRSTKQGRVYGGQTNGLFAPLVLDDMADRIYHVNVLTDSGIVFEFNALHSLLKNPNYPEMIMSLEAYEDRNYTTMTMISFLKMWFPRCEIASSKLKQWLDVPLPR